MHEATGGGAWIVDLLAVVFIGWLVVKGWRMGLLRNVVLVAGLVLAIWAGARYAPEIAAAFDLGLPRGVRYALGFALVFVLVMIAAGIGGRLLGMAIAQSALNPFDRIGGAAFGAFKALVFLALFGVVLAMVRTPSAWVTTYLESRIVRASLHVGEAVVRVVRPYASDQFREFFDEAEGYLREHIQEPPERAPRDSTEI
jgi:membrane protein required for colicin V production